MSGLYPHGPAGPSPSESREAERGSFLGRVREFVGDHPVATAMSAIAISFGATGSAEGRAYQATNGDMVFTQEKGERGRSLNTKAELFIDNENNVPPTRMVQIIRPGKRQPLESTYTLDLPDVIGGPGLATYTITDRVVPGATIFDKKEIVRLTKKGVFTKKQAKQFGNKATYSEVFGKKPFDFERNVHATGNNSLVTAIDTHNSGALSHVGTSDDDFGSLGLPAQAYVGQDVPLKHSLKPGQTMTTTYTMTTSCEPFRESPAGLDINAIQASKNIKCSVGVVSNALGSVEIKPRRTSRYGFNISGNASSAINVKLN